MITITKTRDKKGQKEDFDEQYRHKVIVIMC